MNIRWLLVKATQWLALLGVPIVVTAMTIFAIMKGNALAAILGVIAIVAVWTLVLLILMWLD